jgi:hypothetical protein
LEEARRVNQVFLKLIDTEWGKRWLKAKDLKLEDAFRRQYFGLFSGTCLGQTNAILKLMASHHAKDCRELLEAVSYEDILRYQFAHEMRMSLSSWINLKLFKKGLFIQERDLEKLHKKEDKVRAAALEAFRAENAFPGLVRQKENVPLNEAFVSGIRSIETANPGKIIAGRLMMKGIKSTGHAMFVQCNGGHRRFYDSNGGFYEFPTLESLAEGLHRQVAGYKKIGKVKLIPYAISA